MHIRKSFITQGIEILQNVVETSLKRNRNIVRHEGNGLNSWAIFSINISDIAH